jgi:uncharacterized coiled-coil protein SlyX
MDQRLVNDLAFEFFFTLSSLTDKEELQLPDSVVPVLKEAVDQKNESLQKTQNELIYILKKFKTFQVQTKSENRQGDKTQ